MLPGWGLLLGTEVTALTRGAHPAGGLFIPFITFGSIFSLHLTPLLQYYVLILIQAQSSKKSL